MFTKKYKWTTGLLLVCLFLGLLFLTGCGTDKSKPSDSSKTETEQPKIVNIGWSGPLSGGAAQYGKDTLVGLEMAVDELNGTGGITVNGQKYNFKLISIDDQYKPDMTATAGRRLLAENKTPVIFTVHAGGISALQQFNLDEKFLIVAHTSDPEIAGRDNKLTYIDSPPFAGLPEAYTKTSMEQYGKKIVLLPFITQFGKAWEKMLTETWQAEGGQVVGSFPIDYNKETDFFPYISKALAAKPDVIFVGGPSQPSAMLIKQAKQQGFEGGFIISDQSRFEDIEQVASISDLNGTMGLLPMRMAEEPGIGKFINDFKAKYSKDPTWHPTSMYMAMKVIAMGMEKSGNVDDAEKIYAGMKEVFPIKGDQLPFEIDGISDNGQVMVKDSGVVIRDGKYDLIFPILR